jgi:hypothetical protein
MRTKLIVIALFTVFIASVVVIAQKADSKEKVAEVSFIIGKVVEEGSNQTLKLNEPVYAGAVVTTGKESMCELSLNDDSKIRIAENSKYEVFPKQKSKSSSIFGFLGMGKVWVKLKKLVNRKSYAIKSPNSVISVRGTTFNVEVKSSNSGRVDVFEGRVDAGTHWILENDSLFDAWVREDEKAYKEYLEANDPEKWVRKLEDEYKDAIDKMLKEEQAFYQQDELDFINFQREEQGLPPIVPKKHGPIAEPGKGGWLSFVKANQSLEISGEEHKVVPLPEQEKNDQWIRFNMKRDSTAGW